MTSDVLIVGGGLIGLACARAAASAGAQVTVVDPAPGGGASNVAAGMLAPVTEVSYGEEDRLALNIAAAERWRTFAPELQRTTGIDVGYRTTGTLLVGFDGDDVAAIRDLHRFQSELGLVVDALSGGEAREREPLLSPRVRVALLTGEDHRVETRAVVRALLRSCGDAGVRLLRARVTQVTSSDGRATGVGLEDGAHQAADQVVLAAGAWSGRIGGLPEGTTPPVRPVKGQVLHLRAPDGAPALRTTVRGLVRHRSIYLVPRDDGRLVVGATQEERGFDTSVTAGATRQLLDDAVDIVPGIDELELTETIAGLRPTTPDNAPMIGRGPLDGLVVATGHHRNGVLLTPVTADAVAAILAGREPDPALAVAAPERPALVGRRDGRSRPSLDTLVVVNRGGRADPGDRAYPGDRADPGDRALPDER
jgi:glycine oxidase